MKRAIRLAIMALTAVSCVIDDGEGNTRRTGYQLCRYSENMLNKFVRTPAEDMLFMLSLDEYTSLTAEEQNSPEWEAFRSKIEHYSNTLLKIPSMGITVDTRGVSLSTPGNWWTMTIIDDYRHSENSGYDYYWFDQYSTAPGHGEVKRITCTAADRYEIIDKNGGKDIMLLSIEAIPTPDGGYDLSCMGSGRMAENDNGLSSRYELSEYYYKRYSFPGDDSGNSSPIVSYNVETLDFRVETFHKGQELDWCELAVRNHGEIQYSGNLEFKHNLFYE